MVKKKQNRELPLEDEMLLDRVVLINDCLIEIRRIVKM